MARTGRLVEFVLLLGERLLLKIVVAVVDRRLLAFVAAEGVIVILSLLAFCFARGEGKVGNQSGEWEIEQLGSLLKDER